MIKYLFSFILLVSIISCSAYKYEYREKDNSIFSVKNHQIVTVEIKDSLGHLLTYLMAKQDTRMTAISLTDFSPDYFACAKGCNFKFEKNTTYFIRILPAGKGLRAIKLRLNDAGKLEKVTW